MSVKLEIRRFPVNSMKNRATYRKCLLLSGPDQVSPQIKRTSRLSRRNKTQRARLPAIVSILMTITHRLASGISTLSTELMANSTCLLYTSVCHWDKSFGAYLEKKRSEGKHYNVAISHAAKKLVRLIFAMEKSGKAYLPTA